MHHLRVVKFNVLFKFKLMIFFAENLKCKLTQIFYNLSSIVVKFSKYCCPLLLIIFDAEHKSHSLSRKVIKEVQD